MTLRILMVDDDREDYEIVRDLAEDEGLEAKELVWAPTYEKGVEAVGTDRYDVCLVDYRLGARDGIEFIRDAARKAPDLPLILLTGVEGRDVDRSAMAAGASDYLPKSDLTGSRLERSIRYAVERKRRALAEGRFRALVESTHDLLCILRRDGTLDYASASLRSILGLDSDAMTGRNVVLDVHPDERGRVEEAFARVLSKPGEVVRLRYRVRQAEGRWITLDTVAANHLDDPAIRGVVVNSRNITDRVEAEARLHFQANLLNAVGQAVIATGPEGRVTYWNRAAEEIYGWSEEEAVGRSIMELNTPESGLEDAEEILQRLRRGETWTGEFKVRRRDGSTFPAFVVDSPILDENGRLIGIIGVSSDLTDVKRTEADLHERVKELRTLYRATRTLAAPDVPLDRRLKEIVHLIPTGWLYPAVTEARLCLGELRQATPRFRETPWMLSVPVRTGDNEGRLEVALTEERPERDEGPFLREERELLETIAATVAEAVERQRLGYLHSGTVSSLEEAVFVVSSAEDGLRIRSVNPAGLRMFGYDRDEIVDRTVEILHVDEEAAAGFIEEVLDDLRSSGAFHGDQPMRRKDGSVFHAEQTITLLDPRQGPAGGFVGVVRDVSEGVRAEAELRASEERFRQIAEHIQDVFWIRSADGRRLEYVSPAFREVWGRDPDEAYQQPLSRWEQWVLPSDREWFSATRRKAPREGYEGEYRIIRPDGEIRWIWERAFPVVGAAGDVERVVGVSEDVTERRHLEARFRVLSRQISDVLYVVGPDGTVLFSTPSVEAVGLAREQFEGMNVFELIHPEDRDRVRGRFDEMIARPGETVRLQYRICLAEGRTIHVESVGRNLLDEPSIAGVVVSTRDITERVELEEQLRQSQKMEAVGRLAGGIAHDFNNLLTIIRSQTDLLLMDQEPAGEVAAELATIQQAADRASRLTSQLLAFSRYQVLRPRVVDLSEVVRGMTRLLDRIIGEDVRVEYELPPRLPPVEIDPGQMEQVVMNLAVNARDAMPDGGTLTLSTHMEPTPPGGSEDAEGQAPATVVLRVSDTGAGMEEATKERIFEPFFTTKPTGRGTGLGLSMVYGVVRQSGGSIEVESQQGRGTTFTLCFPAASGEAETPAYPPPPSLDAAPTQGRVLVVEDNPDVRRVVRRILERAGLDVEVAEDAEDAMEKLRAGPAPALLLTDLVLPSASGRDLLEVVRGTRPQLPVVVMSGYAESGPGGRGDLPPDVAFLQKPFTPYELLSLVRNALAGN